MEPPDFRARLAAFPRIAIPDTPGMRRAAVLLCVVESRRIIVIRRAFRGRNAGQWALPGGRVEDGETAEQAAVRELHEELGLTAGPADLIGKLDDFPAASGFAITPIVASMAGPVDPQPSPAEVHSVHLVDLATLAAEDTPHWTADGLLQMRISPDMVIHAPTGALLWQFREIVLLGRPPARVARFTQPDWTRQ